MITERAAPAGSDSNTPSDPVPLHAGTSPPTIDVVAVTNKALELQQKGLDYLAANQFREARAWFDETKRFANLMLPNIMGHASLSTIIYFYYLLGSVQNNLHQMNQIEGDSKASEHPPQQTGNLYFEQAVHILQRLENNITDPNIYSLWLTILIALLQHEMNNKDDYDIEKILGFLTQVKKLFERFMLISDMAANLSSVLATQKNEFDNICRQLAAWLNALEKIAAVEANKLPGKKYLLDLVIQQDFVLTCIQNRTPRDIFLIIKAATNRASLEPDLTLAKTIAQDVLKLKYASMLLLDNVLDPNEKRDLSCCDEYNVSLLRRTQKSPRVEHKDDTPDAAAPPPPLIQAIYAQDHKNISQLFKKAHKPDESLEALLLAKTNNWHETYCNIEGHTFPDLPFLQRQYKSATDKKKDILFFILLSQFTTVTSKNKYSFMQSVTDVIFLLDPIINRNNLIFRKNSNNISFKKLLTIIKNAWRTQSASPMSFIQKQITLFSNSIPPLTLHSSTSTTTIFNNIGQPHKVAEEKSSEAPVAAALVISPKNLPPVAAICRDVESLTEEEAVMLAKNLVTGGVLRYRQA